MSRIARLIASITIPALAAGMVISSAFAQLPSASTVDVKPVGTSKLDPNGGRWFIADLTPGDDHTFQVELFNPTQVVHTVRLYIADMAFDKDGNPYVTNVPTDVGTWGRFAHPVLTIGPLQRLSDSFTLKAPKAADPGDHIGAVVAEQSAEGAGSIKSIVRVAVRLYATLPGDARKDFDIEKVTAARHSVFFPRKLEVTVQLRNTGRVRLGPTVDVNGVKAHGSVLLMSHSAERYVVTQHIPFWGGPQMLHIKATSQLLGAPGPAREMNVMVWVIPWQLFALLALGALIALATRRQLRKRRGRMGAIQSDIRRLERLVTLQHEGRQPTPDVKAEQDDARVAIFTAAKQARRAGDVETAKRLETFLAETARQLNGGGPSRSSESRRTG